MIRYILNKYKDIKSDKKDCHNTENAYDSTLNERAELNYIYAVLIIYVCTNTGMERECAKVKLDIC